MKADCVILNYNDAATVEKLVGQIRGYSCFDHIILVDNASTDDSPKRLAALEDEKVVLVSAGRNGGYGAGNNLGVRYAVREYNASHVLLCNPDVSFSEACVYRMLQAFGREPGIGVVAARMTEGGETIKNGWPLRSFSKELLAMGPVSRRMFKSVLNYPDSRFEGRKAAWVDAVHGSMLMVDTRAFWACKGYDQGIFLYQEETVLARRMKDAGYRTMLVLDESYRHEHSVTISKSVQSAVARQRLREKSVMYYFRHYLHINRFQQLIAGIWFGIIRLETMVWEACK